MNAAAAIPNSHWTGRGRVIVFLLASSSIACLLADFYRVCPMRIFTPLVFLPALAALFAIAVVDRARGDGPLWRAVTIGVGAGLIAAVAYDVFRLPFVFAQQLGIDQVVAPMQLFKVFPRFGAMVLGQSLDQPAYSTAAHLVGWIYHFTNGATFGVMYLAMVGDGARRHWLWAMLFALALELAMLITPYPTVFGIHVTARFVVVTVAAHSIFGITLGLCVRSFCRRAVHRSPMLSPARA